MGLFGQPNIERLVAKGKVEELIKTLNYDKDERVVLAATEGLGQLEDGRAVDPLIQLMKKKKDRNIRQACFSALCKISTSSVNSLISLLGESGLREDAERALIRIGGAAVEGLLSKIGNRSAEYNAVKILGSIKDSRAVDPLIALLERPRQVINLDSYNKTFEASAELHNRNMRRIAVWALGQIGGTRAVDPLIRKLEEDSDDQTRIFAAEGLGKIGDTRAVDSLLYCLRDKSQRLRSVSAHSLSRIGWKPGNEEESISFMAAKFIDSRNWAQECARIGESAVVPLTRMLQDRNSSDKDREFAILSLAEIGSPATSALFSLLNDNAFRKQAVAALDEVGWAPNKGEAGVIYWLAKGEWDKCVDIGEIAVPLLLKELGIAKLENVLQIISALERIGGTDVEEGIKRTGVPLLLSKLQELSNKDTGKIRNLYNGEASLIISALERIRGPEVRDAMKDYLDFLWEKKRAVEREWREMGDDFRSKGGWYFSDARESVSLMIDRVRQVIAKLTD